MRLLRTGPVALVAALVLAGCGGGGSGSAGGADGRGADAQSSRSGSASPSATPTHAPPAPPVPKRGACYSLSYDEAVAPTSDQGAVGCTKPHTSETYAVGTVDDLVHGHLYAVDSTRVQQQVAKACPGRLAAFLGATDQQLRLSLLRPVWFTPTVADSDAGAAWYRCDVIAVDGDRRLARLTSGLEGALHSAAGRARYGMCGTDQPGTPDFRRVLCSEHHTWKAIDTVDLGSLPLPKGAKKGAYPGLDAVRQAGADPCAAAARAIAADTLDYQWGYEWPTRSQWQAGQTYGRCWAPG